MASANSAIALSGLSFSKWARALGTPPAAGLGACCTPKTRRAFSTALAGIVSSCFEKAFACSSFLSHLKTRSRITDQAATSSTDGKPSATDSLPQRANNTYCLASKAASRAPCASPISIAHHALKQDRVVFLLALTLIVGSANAGNSLDTPAGPSLVATAKRKSKTSPGSHPFGFSARRYHLIASSARPRRKRQTAIPAGITGTSLTAGHSRHFSYETSASASRPARTSAFDFTTSIVPKSIGADQMPAGPVVLLVAPVATGPRR